MNTSKMKVFSTSICSSLGSAMLAKDQPHPSAPKAYLQLTPGPGWRSGSIKWDALSEASFMSIEYTQMLASRLLCLRACMYAHTCTVCKWL